jgi:hypothetical protein
MQFSPSLGECRGRDSGFKNAVKRGRMDAAQRSQFSGIVVYTGIPPPARILNDYGLC